jgi:hypothetical protein
MTQLFFYFLLMLLGWGMVTLGIKELVCSACGGESQYPL